jgi:hypothetical protein
MNSRVSDPINSVRRARLSHSVDRANWRVAEASHDPQRRPYKALHQRFIRERTHQHELSEVAARLLIVWISAAGPRSKGRRGRTRLQKGESQHNVPMTFSLHVFASQQVSADHKRAWKVSTDGQFRPELLRSGCGSFRCRMAVDKAFASR